MTRRYWRGRNHRNARRRAGKGALERARGRPRVLISKCIRNPGERSMVLIKRVSLPRPALCWLFSWGNSLPRGLLFFKEKGNARARARGKQRGARALRTRDFVQQLHFRSSMRIGEFSQEEAETISLGVSHSRVTCQLCSHRERQRSSAIGSDRTIEIIDSRVEYS